MFMKGGVCEPYAVIITGCRTGKFILRPVVVLYVNTDWDWDPCVYC